MPVEIWKGLIGVGAVIFISLFLYGGFGYARSQTGSEKWSKYFLDNFSFVVGLPMAMTAAFGLVVFFDVTTDDPIELSLWGLVLKGPAGPLTMWIAVFLSIVLGIKVLSGKNSGK